MYQPTELRLWMEEFVRLSQKIERKIKELKEMCLTEETHREVERLEIEYNQRKNLQGNEQTGIKETFFRKLSRKPNWNIEEIKEEFWRAEQEVKRGHDLRRPA